VCSGHSFLLVPDFEDCAAGVAVKRESTDFGKLHMFNGYYF
jgi:hypothetical protein